MWMALAARMAAYLFDSGIDLCFGFLRIGEFRRPELAYSPPAHGP